MITVLTLLAVGLLLLLAETILPGLIAGIFGLASLTIGIIVAYQTFGHRGGTLTLFGVLAALLAGGAAWIKYFPDTRIARTFVSDRTVGDVCAEKPELLHQNGTALTPLRPSGTALINGRRVDVLTEGAMVAKGTPVKVVAIEGIRVVVRPV